MRIGQLADATGVTAKTLRYYESEGLLREPDRTPSGYRDYPAETVDRLAFITDELHRLGYRVGENRVARCAASTASGRRRPARAARPPRPARRSTTTSWNATSTSLSSIRSG